MVKPFRPYDLDQRLLLPPDLREWLPDDHLALFVSDVVDGLDLSAILDTYESGDGRGQPPYHPAMMVKLLLYAYCVGKPSSRKIERATYEDVAFRVLAADQHPDHDTIAEFRQRHLPALARLFVQGLLLCQRAGLVTLGHVALDSTRIKANASKHKAMSYARMEERAGAAAPSARVAGPGAAGRRHRGRAVRPGPARRRAPSRAGAAREPAAEDPRGPGGAGGRGPGTGSAGGAGGEGEARRPERARRPRQRRGAQGARSRAGAARAERTAQLYRPRFADHEGPCDEELRAGVQRAGGCRRPPANHRRLQPESVGRRHRTVCPDARAGAGERGSAAGRRDGGCRLFQ